LCKIDTITRIEIIEIKPGGFQNIILPILLMVVLGVENFVSMQMRAPAPPEPRLPDRYCFNFHFLSKLSSIMNQNFYQLPKSAIVLLLLIFLGAISLTAQDRRINGKVSVSDGAFPGATIVQKGTTNGTVSDVNGAFALTVKGADAVVVVSASGYETQELPVGSQTTFDILLKENVNTLSELVVTGYTVDTRRQTTGSVSTVKTRDLQAVPTGNVEQQLQGRVAGVTVITNGQPGTSSIVRVRGFGAFGGNEPLYVVDGVPVGSVDFLAPDDIESTTVLKDAASASIYGARAANGVIVFTTKRGKKTPQKLTVTYDALVGVTNPGTAPTVLNPQEQADWTWNALRNAGEATKHPQYGSGSSPVLPDYINVGGASGVVGSVDLAAEKLKYNIDPSAGPIYQVVKANKSGTDWFGAITRNAPMTRHSLGFSGATESSRYYLSFNLQDQAGILLNNSFKRYGFRANTEFDLSKRIHIGENLQFSYRQVLGQQGGNNGQSVASDENDILTAFRMAPIIPIYDEFGGYGGTAAKGFNNPRNPVATRDGIANDRNFNVLGFGNLYLDVEPIDGLTLRSSIGGGYSNYFYHSYGRLQYENSENNSSFSYSEGAGNFFTWVFTNTADYKKTFGLHSVDLLVGIEALNTGKGRAFNGSGLNPFSTDPNYVTLNTVSSTGKVVTSDIFNGVNFFSQFGRLNYGYNDKYYLTGVIRRDGSSRFGANTRYGIFPAVSAAWRVTGENFMKGQHIFDDLKIRGGWGQMGNSNNVDPSNQFTLYGSSTDNGSYDINGSNTSAAAGFNKSRIGNPNAKWETSTTTNIGIDALLFKGKLDVIVDLWKKETKDLLFTVPLSYIAGGNYASPPSINIASMENKGIDIQLVNKGKFSENARYELTVTGAWLHNEITALAPNVKYFDVYNGNRLSGPPTRNAPGYSIAAFYGYQVLGYFKDANDVSSSPTQAGAGPGRFKFADLNSFDADGHLTGKPDGKIDDADRTFIGSPVPKFIGGVNLKVILGNFDFETYIYTSLGNKIFNQAKWFTDFYPSFPGAAISTRVKNSWTPTNLNADAPIFEDVSNFSTNTQPNSWYVEDGSYLRMQNLTIGFNMPKAWFNNRLSRARLFASVNNIFTVTKYKGLDPGVGGAADTNFGIDVGNYPVTRSYMFGVGVTF
jgi:TonB-linked SusC/RagA family outer membrane protein